MPLRIPQMPDKLENVIDRGSKNIRLVASILMRSRQGLIGKQINNHSGRERKLSKVTQWD